MKGDPLTDTVTLTRFAGAADKIGSVGDLQNQQIESVRRMLKR